MSAALLVARPVPPVSCLALCFCSNYVLCAAVGAWLFVNAVLGWESVSLPL